MKKPLAITFILLILITFSTPVFALQIYTKTWGNGYNYEYEVDGWVGEINVSSSGTQSERLLPSFNTFCLEIDERTNWHTTYNAVINDRAVKGGEDTSDLLDSETAWLYSEYLNGAFSNDWDNGQAVLLQGAIWALEGEITLNDPNNNYYYNIATSEERSGLYGIRVLNLTSSSGDLRQDFLAKVAPVPEPSTMLLLGTGLLGLFSFSRKTFFTKS